MNLTRRIGLVALVGGAASLAWLVMRFKGLRRLDPVPEPGRHQVRVVETRRIVPSPGLPPEIKLGTSNNNLDAVRHSDGHVYLAFRTAPNHFASSETLVHVIRSRDEVHWTHEASFSAGTDLREPRLLSLGDKLFLYVSRLGKDAFAFEPQGMAVSQRHEGKWSALEPMGPPGIMGWRVRRLGEVPVFLVYSGGESLYDLRRPHLEVRLWKTSDGRNWTPFDPARPVIYAGGGSEADCVLGDDGFLYGVIRNEAGDDTGWGSKICRAPAASPAAWTCRSDPRKYDSPFMLWHDGEAYLIARRNLNGRGEYDLGVGRSWLFRTAWNQVNYSLSPKRTALWRYVREEDRFAWVLDLPSRGDCCFPAVLPGEDPAEYVVYDYSSDLHGPDVSWLRGQLGRTFIYRHVLRFEGGAAPANTGRAAIDPAGPVQPRVS